MEPNDYRFPQIVISSGERQVWPDGNAFGVVLSGERQLWPDGARSKLHQKPNIKSTVRRKL